jgi:hypothetical protein
MNRRMTPSPINSQSSAATERLREAILAISRDTNSTESVCAVFRLLEDRFDTKSALAIRRARHEIAGEEHDGPGRPAIDDTQSLACIADAIGRGATPAHAISSEARRLSRSGGSEESHKHRLRAKLARRKTDDIRS